MTMGGLFAGIGGFELAAQWAGIQPLWSNEIDPFCCKVLRKNFNHRIIEDDIKNIGGETLKAVDIICGGFPCQPFSVAGKREGKEDDRYLWGEMLRVISEIRPSYVIGENVAGLVSMDGGRTLERILLDLEAEGYRSEVFLIPACGVGAWHRRDRVWIIAYTNECYEGRASRRLSQADGREGVQQQQQQVAESGESVEVWVYPNNGGKRVEGVAKEEISGVRGIQGGEDVRRIESFKGLSYLPKPLIRRGDDGFSGKMDRLKALGNAIVPQVAYELFNVIKNEI